MERVYKSIKSDVDSFGSIKEAYSVGVPFKWSFPG